MDHYIKLVYLFLNYVIFFFFFLVFVQYLTIVNTVKSFQRFVALLTYDIKFRSVFHGIGKGLSVTNVAKEMKCWIQTNIWKQLNIVIQEKNLGQLNK